MSDDLRDQLQSTLGDQYNIEREMGGGGMSRVFLAEEKALGRKVVVKVLLPDLAAAVSVERFKREIVMAARLQHPHIVPVLTAGEVNGLPYYTMPLVRGESLRARLTREGELPVNDTVRILHDVAAALAHAHSDGVVHRDIKPDNVMLTGGSAVVTDLGVSKAVNLAASDPGGHSSRGGLTSVGVALGTPAYMSPEQAAADPNVDHRSDIYAVGCMAYEMLTGATPFTARNASQMIAAQLSETPEPLEKRRESTPAALALLVMKCLAKRPADRPQSANEIMAALEGMTSTGAVAAVVATAGAQTSTQKALTWFFASAFIVVALAYAATELIGLPSWVPLGAIIVMALGLPAIMFTGWVQKMAARAAAHPTHTPGGTAAHPSTAGSIATRVSRHVSWRKTTMGGVAAVGAFVLLIVAYMATRAMGIGPAASLSAAGMLDKNQKVLVADFTARGTDSTLAMLAAEAVRTALGQSDALIPVPESEVSAILRLMGQADTARLNVALARNIAQREGHRAVVTGDITALPANEGLVVTLRLLAAESGDQIVAFRETIAKSSDLIPALGRLSKSLRAKAGESLKSVRATRALERVTTASLDALREFVEGSRANRNRQAPLAVEHLRKAVAIDSLFATAWSSLGVNLQMVNAPREQRYEAFQRSYDLRQRLSDSERYRVESAYFLYGPPQNREQAARVFEEWLRKDSSYFVGSTGANNYAGLLNGRRQFQRAEEILQLMLDADLDTPINQDGLINAQFNQGHTEDALASIERAKRKFPDMVTPNGWEMAFLYQRGQLDSLDEHLGRIRSQRTGALRVAAIRGQASQARLRGQLDKSLQFVAEVDGSLPWAVALNQAFANIWVRKQPERGVAQLDSILRLHPLSEGAVASRPYQNFATFYALAGRTDKAREIMRERERALDTVSLRAGIPIAQSVNAEIALAEGRPLEAIKFYRQADTLPDGPNGNCSICLFADLGRSFHKASMPDSVIYWYEKYLNTPYMLRYLMGNDPNHLATAYIALGESYEAKGDRTRARGYYQKFVKLWEKADAALQPRVAEIRARIVAETPRRGGG